jgi:hypothetical protein
MKIAFFSGSAAAITLHRSGRKKSLQITLLQQRVTKNNTAESASGLSLFYRFSDKDSKDATPLPPNESERLPRRDIL